MLQIGFFLFFNLMAFGFLFYAVAKKRALFGDILLMLTMVLFFMLGFYMLPEEDIGTHVIESTVNGTTGIPITNSTQTHIFIEDSETFYLIYIYWGMAMLSLILMMLGHIKTKQGDAWI